MKAVRLHAFHQQPVIDEVPEPTVHGPLEVLVKIGGAGVCRTDLHIIEGQWDAAMGTPLPYILGHENAGWVAEIGSAVTNVALGDAGITAYHAVRKALPLLYPGTTAVVIGAGGLGHIGIQCLAALSATTIVVVDRNPDALKL